MRIATIGSGAAGMLASLMLARAGHDVVLIDQDDLTPAPDVETAAAGASRPSAPQVVQPHVVMSRCRLVLRDRLPDILAALVAAGAKEAALADRLPPGLADLPAQPGDDDLTIVMTRRSTFDWVLRRAVADEPGVEVHAARVTGLRTHRSAVPVAQGVDTDQGPVPADVVVDASGRRSPVDRWLEECGARPAPSVAAECGVTYFGRHYRLRTTSGLPGPITARIVVPFDEFTAVLFCSDNGAVQTALAPLTTDRRYRALADDDIYHAVLTALPTHRDWMPFLEPISPVRQMVAPHNTLRRLVVDGAPVVTGLLPVGDAVCTTNPTFGRGLSLASWGAADVVDVLADHAGDPAGQVLALDARIADHVAPYYFDQAAVDSARLAALRHRALGTPLPPPPPGGTGSVTFPQLRAASAVDPVALRALWQLMGMLRRPDEIYRDPAVAESVRAAEAGGGFQPDPRPEPELLAAALSG